MNPYFFVFLVLIPAGCLLLWRQYALIKKDPAALKLAQKSGCVWIFLVCALLFLSRRIPVALLLAVFAVVAWKLDANRQSGARDIRRTQQGEPEQRREEQTRAFSTTAEEARFHAILGSRPGMSFEEIKKAYHQRVREYHPDKVRHLGDDLQRLAEQKMRDINEAYSYFERKYR